MSELQVNENIVNEEELKETYTTEEVATLIGELLPQVDVNTDNCQGLELDANEFKVGIDSISFVCGQISALRGVGLTTDQAMEIVMNQQNIEYNLELNRDTAKSNIEVAKVQQVQMQQNQI